MNKDIRLFIICLTIGGLIPMALFGVGFYERVEHCGRTTALVRG